MQCLLTGTASSGLDSAQNFVCSFDILGGVQCGGLGLLSVCSFLNGGFVMRVQMVYRSWFTLDLFWKACLCVSPVTVVVSVEGCDCSITFDAHLSSQKLLSGAATPLRKATVSFTSVRPSDRTEHFSAHWTDFHEIWYLRIFKKSIEKIQVSLKSDNYNGHDIQKTMDIYDILLNSTMRNVDKIKTHFVLRIVCSKIVSFVI
jgi:hypothetical protein